MGGHFSYLDRRTVSFNIVKYLGILGVFLSSYLALLKIVDLPCISGGACGNIIHSKYASLLGLPVSFYSLFLWSIFLSNPSSRTGKGVAIILGVGSAFFTIIQIFLLDGFCILCFIHALTCWAILPVALTHHPSGENKFSLTLFLLPNVFLLAVLLIITQKQRSTISQKLDNLGAAQITESSIFPFPIGYELMDSIGDSSKKLLVSFDCNHCVQLLSEYLRLLSVRIEQNLPLLDLPTIFFKTAPDNANLTAKVLSAFEQSGKSIRTLQECIFLINEGTLNGDSYETILDTLDKRFPTPIQDEILNLLSSQRKQFEIHNINSVPHLLIANMPISRFSAEDLVDAVERPMLSVTEQLDGFGIIPAGAVVTKKGTVKNLGSSGAYLLDGELFDGAGQISFANHYLYPGQETTFEVSLKNTEATEGKLEIEMTYHLPKFASMGVSINASFEKNGYVIQSRMHHLSENGIEFKLISLNKTPIHSIEITNPNLRIEQISKNGNLYSFRIQNIKEGFLESYNGIVEFEIEITDSKTSRHRIYYENGAKESEMVESRSEPIPPSIRTSHDHLETKQNDRLLNSPLRLYSKHPLNQNILVVSPTCPACLERILEFEARLQRNADESVPEFIWDSHGNQELLSYVISYILHDDSNLTPMIRWLQSLKGKDLNSTEIQHSFSRQFPSVFVSKHHEIVGFYSAWLEKHPIAAVPSLITPSGLITTSFSAEDLSNDQFSQAKLVPLKNSIELGVRKPGEEVQFAISVQNKGTAPGKLLSTSVPSLPQGRVQWEQETIDRNQVVSGSVKWKIPDDYFGEAFARFYYNVNGLELSIPVHLLVPFRGWVWPTIESDFVNLPQTTFEVRNVQDPQLHLVSVLGDIPGFNVSLSRKDNKTIQFTKIGNSEQSEKTVHYHLNVKASDGESFEIPIIIHQ